MGCDLPVMIEVQKEDRIKYITSNEEAQADVAVLMLSNDEVLGFDTETESLPKFCLDPKASLDPYRSKIRLMQFYSADFDTVYVFDMRAVTMQTVSPLFDRALVAHNAVFDVKMVIHAGYWLKDIRCTAVEAARIDSKNLRSLADLAYVALGQEMDKTEQVSDWSADELSISQIRYAAKDAKTVWQIHSVMDNLCRKLLQ